MTSAANQFGELETLLEAEREALLAGDLRRIADLLPRKEALVATVMERGWQDPKPAQELQSRLERNQMLLDGAMEGIRSVAARLKSLQQVREALDTYDADGKKRSVKRLSGGNVERRA
ncbi:flagellar biosynthesis protein FlgN [Sulfitobacter sp. HNIBRBA3233]|uniref:flagellar biosynthesis protein FlgN n=1 Tax=Sulfitobacter marinivivus TaxID=3158558 RepID=UPI0032E018F4